MTTRAATARGTSRRAARFIAPLTPDSWDEDARADATNPAVLAALEEGRRSGLEPGGTVTAAELRRQRAFTAEEIAATCRRHG